MRRIVVALGLFCCIWMPKAFCQELPERFKLTFSHRTRMTAFDNAITLSDDMESWAFSRHKTSLGFQYRMFRDIDFVVKMSNESRIWFAPQTKKSALNEVFFDQLFLKWKRVGDIPVDVTLGRQNIILDEGFMCLDGQPLTGSRSIYFNALRGDLSINKDNKITSFISYVPRTDNLLPVFNEGDSPQMLEEQGNMGIGMYYRGKIKRSSLSLYYFLKKTNENVIHHNESVINAFGCRWETQVWKRTRFTAEGALQTGRDGNQKRRAFGGYAHLDYDVNMKFPEDAKFTLGGFCLSGDDPATRRQEGWDPLWSRWPKWSESYIYTLIVENKGKVAYWSNICSLYASFKGNLSQRVSFQTSCHKLMALQDNISDFCCGTGKKRGRLLTLRLDYKIDEKWSGHFVAENFNPGDFYDSKAQNYNWLRFELLFIL